MTATPAPDERFTAIECRGDSRCPAADHIEGCFASAPATPAPDVTDRTDATDAEFAQRIAAYPADVAYAAMVEQVARAIAAAAWDREIDLSKEREVWQAHYRRLAAAAIAALPAHPAVDAVKRVEALAEDLDREAETAEKVSFSTVSANRRAAATRIRAALAPQPADAEGTGR